MSGAGRLDRIVDELSPQQRHALVVLAEHDTVGSGYLGVRTNTLYALEARGIVRVSHYPSTVASITPHGREVAAALLQRG